MIGAKMAQIAKCTLGFNANRKIFIVSFDIDKFKWVNNAYNDNYDDADNQVLVPLAKAVLA